MPPRSSLKVAPDGVVVSAGSVADANEFADLTDADDDQFRDTGAASIHATQAANLRADQPLHDMADASPWTPPSNLDAPPPRPGMSQRWVRVGANGEDDPTNLAAKLREGWQPRRADTVPAGYAPPTIAHGTYAGCIGVGGMVLFEMPSARIAERTVHYRHLAARQTEAVRQALVKASEPGHPISVDSQRIVTSRRPPVAAD